MLRNINSVCIILCSLVLSAVAPAEERSVNLVRNGSFEAGIDSGFSVGRWYVNGLPSALLDGTTKVHGRYSIKIPFSRTAFLSKPAQYEGMQFRSAVPITVERGRSYNFSVYLKADTPRHGELSITPNSPSEHRGDAIAIKPVEVGTMWRRVGLRFTARNRDLVYWQINVASESPGYLWIDAVQLESGNFSEYRPHAAVEAGITSPAPGMIYDAGKPVVLTLMAYNSSPSRLENYPFEVGVYDLYERKIDSITISETLEPDSGITRSVELRVSKNGIYRATLSSPSSSGVAGEIHFSVLPKSRPVPSGRSAFGVYLTISPESLVIAKRLGFHWIAHLTSNGRLYSWGNVEPKEGEFLWYDEDIALARNEDFHFMFNLEPCNAPQWAAALDAGERLMKWKNYVSAMVRHYREDAVRYWTISDEAQSKNCWASPREYALWHRAGYEAIKETDPKAKVVFNTSAEYAEQVFKVLSPQYVDILAGNFYHMPTGIERLQELAARYGGKEIWAPGVGEWMLPYYEQHLSREQRKSLTGDYWTAIVTRLVKNVVETFAFGSNRLFHYTATYVGNTNNFSLFEADSSLKPNGAQFAALIWLIDGFSEARPLAVPGFPQNPTIAAYRIDRLDGISVFAFWSLQPSVNKIELLNITSTTGLQLYDQFANSIPITKTSTSLKLEANAAPLFLVVPQRLANTTEGSLGRALSAPVSR